MSQRRSFRIPTDLRRELLNALYTLENSGDRLRPSEFFERGMATFLEAENVLTVKAQENAREEFARFLSKRKVLEMEAADRNYRILDHHMTRVATGLTHGYSEERKWRREMRCLERAGELIDQIFYVAGFEDWLERIEDLRRRSDRWWPGLTARGVSHSFWVQLALQAEVTRVREQNGGILDVAPTGWEVPSGRRPKVNRPGIAGGSKS
jgi:hypothetical protein